MDSGTQGQSARFANTPLPRSYRLARTGLFLGCGLVLCFVLLFLCLPFLPDDSNNNPVAFIITFLGLGIGFIFFSIGVFWLLLRSLRDRFRVLGFEAMAASQPWILYFIIGRDLFREPPSRLRECLANPDEQNDYEFAAAWWEAESLEGRGPSPRALADFYRDSFARGELPRTRTGRLKDCKRLWHVLPFLLWLLFVGTYAKGNKPPLDPIFLPLPVLAFVSLFLLPAAHSWVVARRLGYSFRWFDVFRISLFYLDGWFWLPPRAAWNRAGIAPPRTIEDYKLLLTRWHFVIRRIRRKEHEDS